MILAPPSLSTSSAGAYPNSAARWALDLAVAAGLITLLDVTIGGAVQFGLFMAGLMFKSLALRHTASRPFYALQIFYYLATLPVFLQLSGKTRLGEEWLPVRVIAYALLGGLYLLPLILRCSMPDLRRVTVVLAGSFFFSAIYFSTPLFLMALLGATFALFVAFHALSSHLRAEETKARLMRVATGHLLYTLILGSVFFFGFPRDWFRAPWGSNPMGKGLISGPQARSQDMFEVGASSRRDMLQFANLLDWSRSGGEVLRLRMTWNKTGEPIYATNSLYLRASLFEAYTEGNWRSRLPSRTIRDSDDGTSDGWTWVQPGIERAGARRIRQHIQMSALDDFCFCLPEPLAINLPTIKYETRGILIFPNKPLLSVDYEVISELPLEYDDPKLQEPSRLRIPIQMSRYLEIPQDLRSTLNRINSRWDRRTHRAVLAEQIRQYLQNQFTYGPTGFAPEENLDATRFFLTRSKQGYCTHFASAMALLARSVGLPARVATGFHFAGPPEADGAYVIRELNAHAWTEIFFPDYGWIIFDATPPSRRPTMEQGPAPLRWWSFFIRLAGLTDQLAEYDSTDQRTFVQRLLTASIRGFHGGLTVIQMPWFWIALILSAALCRMGFRKLSLHQRRRLMEIISRKKPASTVPFYADLLWILARHGYPKLPALTAQEFAESVTRHVSSPAILEITHRFNQVKFGGQDLNREEHQTLQAQLNRLEITLSNHQTDH